MNTSWSCWSLVKTTCGDTMSKSLNWVVINSEKKWRLQLDGSSSMPGSSSGEWELISTQFRDHRKLPLLYLSSSPCKATHFTYLIVESCPSIIIMCLQKNEGVTSWIIFRGSFCILSPGGPGAEVPRRKMRFSERSTSSNLLIIIASIIRRLCLCHRITLLNDSNVMDIERGSVTWGNLQAISSR